MNLEVYSVSIGNVRWKNDGVSSGNLRCAMISMAVPLDALTDPVQWTAAMERLRKELVGHDRVVAERAEPVVRR